MMIVRSKMGFDPDLNLRRWLYALDFREPPPEISVFLFKSKVLDKLKPIKPATPVIKICINEILIYQ